MRPLLDDQAPLLLRANCVRSLALLCASDPGARARVQKAHPAATLTGAISAVLDATDSAVRHFSSDSNKGGTGNKGADTHGEGAASFGARVSTVTRLHGFNLLALLLHDGGGGVGGGGGSPTRSSAPAIAEQGSRKKGRRRRARLDQSHIPEWRRVVVSPPSGRGDFWGQNSPGSPENSSSPARPTIMGSPEQNGSRASLFAVDFFDEMMATDAQVSASLDNLDFAPPAGSGGARGFGSPKTPSSSAKAMHDIIAAFTSRDRKKRLDPMDVSSSAGLLRQLCGPTHGVSPPKKITALPPPQQAWATPERDKSAPPIDEDFFAKLASPTIGHRYPKISGKKPGRSYAVDLPPPPPSPRANSMRPVTPRLDEAPMQALSDRQLHRDQKLLLRAHYRNRDEDGAEEWALENQLRDQRRSNASLPPMQRGQEHEDLVDLLSLVAPPDTRRMAPSSALRLAYQAGYNNAARQNPHRAAEGISRNINAPGSMVLLPGTIAPLPAPPLRTPQAPPPAPSSSSSVFLWLPSELQSNTQNLIVRTELAREATRRAQIGLAQHMAREMLKLPFDFMADHGTPEMLVRVGALAFRVAMQRLGQRRLRETWAKLMAWLSKCRAADARRLRLLSRMFELIELYQDRRLKRTVRFWNRWARKLNWIAKRQRWGSTRLQRILTKASRRNARRRLQNAYMTLKRLVEKYHEDMMRRRMAASKLRKIIWRRLLRRKKKVLLVLRRMGSEPYVVKLQWAYRRRLWGRHARARYIQNYYRRYRAVCLAQKRKSSIRSVATAFVLNVCLPPMLPRAPAAIVVQRAWRRRQEERDLAIKFIYFVWWLPARRLRDFRSAMCFLREKATLIQQTWRERHYAWAIPATIRLQRLYRSRMKAVWCFDDLVLSALLKRQIAARHIARVWRGFVGRKRRNRRRKYLARQTRAALKLQRAWAINQGFFSTFVLTTSLKISSGNDTDRWRRRRRQIRWNATVLVQAYIRAMVARKKGAKWMAFMRRQKRIENLVWGARKFRAACLTAVGNAQRLWRGRESRIVFYEEMKTLQNRRASRDLGARVIQFAWLRSAKSRVPLFDWNPSADNDDESTTSLAAAPYPERMTSSGMRSSMLVTSRQNTSISTTETMLIFRMRQRRLHWTCALASATKGYLIPHARMIERVYRGYRGRLETYAARTRRNAAMRLQNGLFRPRNARNARHRRQDVVNKLGCRLFMDVSVCGGLAAMYLIVYNPAARAIQNSLYRAWKAREPLRQAHAATVIQCRWRCILSRQERRRRKRGMARRNANPYGDKRKLWAVFEKVMSQTVKRMYHPSDDMGLEDDMDLGRFLARLGLRTLKSQFSRRGVEDLQSLYAVCGFAGTKTEEPMLGMQIVTGYKESALSESRSELDDIAAAKSDAEKHRKAWGDAKLELAMLNAGGKKRKKKKGKANKRQEELASRLNWKDRTKKESLQKSRDEAQAALASAEERLALAKSGREQRRKAATVALASKMTLKAEQATIACERILSMLEGDADTRARFRILDTVPLLQEAVDSHELAGSDQSGRSSSARNDA